MACKDTLTIEQHLDEPTGKDLLLSRNGVVIGLIRPIDSDEGRIIQISGFTEIESSTDTERIDEPSPNATGPYKKIITATFTPHGVEELIQLRGNYSDGVSLSLQFGGSLLTADKKSLPIGFDGHHGSYTTSEGVVGNRGYLSIKNLVASDLLMGSDTISFTERRMFSDNTSVENAIPIPEELVQTGVYADLALEFTDANGETVEARHKVPFSDRKSLEEALRAIGESTAELWHGRATVKPGAVVNAIEGLINSYNVDN